MYIKISNTGNIIHCRYMYGKKTRLQGRHSSTSSPTMDIKHGHKGWVEGERECQSICRLCIASISR